MAGNKKGLYIETTIPSYATSRASRDMIIANRQVITKFFWENERQKYDLFVSQYVIDECIQGDHDAARRRLEFIKDLPSFPKTEENAVLAGTYYNLLDIPERAKADCSHLSVCVIEKIDYLLSWNFTHLGMISYIKIHDYNEKHGLWTPLLVTPDALIELEKDYEVP
jgi:hypothetical protein